MAQGEATSWIKVVGEKIVPWAIMGIIVGGVNLYTDNIENKRDIARNTWRNDQQDSRMEKLDTAITGIQESQSEFHREAITRLDKLVIEKERRIR